MLKAVHAFAAILVASVLVVPTVSQAAQATYDTVVISR